MINFIREQYTDQEVDSLIKMCEEEWLRFDVHAHANGLVVVEAQPGNGTRYSFVLVKVNEIMSRQMGLHPEGYLLAMEPGPHWRGTMSVKDPGSSFPDYIMEKLGMNLSDAVAMSLILSRVEEVLSEPDGPMPGGPY